MRDINSKGMLNGVLSAMPVFKQQGTGHIIDLISTAGIKISPTMGVYAGTKNAVRTITEALRQESGGRYRVTGISPGFVKTELADHIKDSAMKTTTQQRMDAMGMEPKHIANAIVYAMSLPDILTSAMSS